MDLVALWIKAGQGRTFEQVLIEDVSPTLAGWRYVSL